MDVTEPGCRVEFGTHGRGTVRKQTNLGRYPRPSKQHVWVEYDEPIGGYEGISLPDGGTKWEYAAHVGGWFSVDYLRSPAQQSA